eukprot:GHUV01001981.1.p1 GENE.GHUV01001981.1~~GHUV01001981.1.p1  ORF type:complete len:376 (+),score=110.86 GHUV01001981.1:258-1385(+)
MAVSADGATLAEVAAALAAPGKGLLASDESVGTISKRLEKAGLVNDESTRHAYRELYYTSPLGEAGISGAIMFKEALYQSASDGTPFVECLKRQGVMPGIKVDEGLLPFEGHDLATGETSTKGLEALAAAAAEYVKAGARFAKWRAALRINESKGYPSERAVELNAQQLAEYAVICQAAGLVPIVEPEVLIDGPHSMQVFGAVSERVISTTVAQLWRKEVQLEGCLLKPQMVIPGADSGAAKPSPDDVAAATLTCMRRVVPAAIPGIMFLSGGQSEEEATINLNAINRTAQKQGKAPWSLSFSYGRALQASVLKIWSEDRSQAQEAKQMAVALAAANAAASLGRYEGPHPSVTSAKSLREEFRGWRADESVVAAK